MNHDFHSLIIKDQLHRTVELKYPPKRIISLVPSQTELLFDLGLDEEVIGITKFCVHPESWFKTKTRIGGTKNLNIEKIKSLQPDLIIGNKEENNEKQIKQLMNEYPVWMSDIKTLEDALVMIESIGELVNKKSKAAEIKNQIENNFAKLSQIRLPLSEVEMLKLQTLNPKPEISNIKHQTLNLRTAYAIWYNPLMIAATDTFINNMLHHCGFENAFAQLQRYPTIDFETLQNAKPDFIFLSSEPFPFKQKHVDEMKALCPDAKVMLVNGEYFSWYGSRLIDAPEYFKNVLNDLM